MNLDQIFSIHSVLRDLIEKKSQKDKSTFTAYQLAKAIDVPRSVISALTHPDQLKRVTNPRIETLLKIVNFFRKDGFDITLESLLGIKKNAVDLSTQRTASTVSLPVYPLSGINAGPIKKINVNLSFKSKNVIAFFLEKDIKPVFKSGSIFIINRDAVPENENMIAAKIDEFKEIIIGIWNSKNGKTKITPIDTEKPQIIIMPTRNYTIIGVVVQINIK